jgi:hypothetical protein
LHSAYFVRDAALMLGAGKKHFHTRWQPARPITDNQGNSLRIQSPRNQVFAQAPPLRFFFGLRHFKVQD